MGEEVLVKIGRDWIYAILVPIPSAVITGVIVGLVVGFIFRQRRLKDLRESFQREEKLETAQQLIQKLYSLQDDFCKDAYLIIDALNRLDYDSFMDKYLKLYMLIHELELFVKINKTKLDLKITVDVRLFARNLTDFKDTTFNYFPHQKPRKITAPQLKERCNKAYENLNSIREKFNKIIPEVIKYRANL